MNTPNLMPTSITPPRNTLEALINQTTTTIHAYLAAGLTEETALALTDITLDRYDQGA